MKRIITIMFAVAALFSSGTLLAQCADITVAPPSLSDGVSGSAYSATFTQTGGTAPVTWSTDSALPSGIALSSAGVLSGLPTQVGTFPLRVLVTDNAGCVAGQFLPLTIVAPADTPPVAANVNPAPFDEDTAATIALSYTDAESNLATTCSVTAPSNVSVSTPCACAAGICSVGVIGAQDYNGAAGFQYTVTANGLTSLPATATLAINAVNDPPTATITIVPPSSAVTYPLHFETKLAVSDVDAAAAPVTVTIGASEGTIQIVPNANPVTIGANNSALVTLTGSLADINSVLSGTGGAQVLYSDGTHTSLAEIASIIITLSANDGGATGSGGAQVASDNLRLGGAVLSALPHLMVLNKAGSGTFTVTGTDAHGNNLSPAATFTSASPTIVSVGLNTGVATAGTTFDSTTVNIASTGFPSVTTYVCVAQITDVTVGTSLPSSIAATDPWSCVGDPNGLPTKSYYADEFRITMTAGQTLSFKADSGDNLDTYMLLFDSNGFILAGNDDDDDGILGVGSHIVFTAPATGTYYIEQSTFNGLDTGAYTFIVETAPVLPKPAKAGNGIPHRGGAKQSKTR